MMVGNVNQKSFVCKTSFLRSGNNVSVCLHVTGLRFDKEIEIILKYRDCLKVLRLVICKYKDLVAVWVLSFKETLF